MNEWWKSKDPYVFLDGIANLEEGWSGPDTKTFTEEHIKRCKAICDAFMAAGLPPYISPSEDAIHLYWECEEMENQLEIIVPSDGEATYAKETEPDYLIEGVVGSDLTHLIMWVKP